MREPEEPSADVVRAPLDEAALRGAVVRPGGLWSGLRVVASTGSTNADLAAAARDGAPEGEVLLAEEQVAGRGRLGRSWVTPAGTAIMCSVVLRPGEPVPERGWAAVPRTRYAWLPMLTGVALVAVVRRETAVEAVLKWPNDLLLGPEQRKCAGILVETVPVGDAPATIVGVGVNVGQRQDELPAEVSATSLALAGAVVDRAALVREFLHEFDGWYTRWRAADGDPQPSGLLAAYRRCCGTLGRHVTVHLPGGGRIVGAVIDIDTDGRLLVAPDDGAPTAVAAGDIVHLR